MIRDKIRQQMDELGITISGLAKRSGIPYHTIRSYLYIGSDPTCEKMKKLAGALGRTVDWFLGDESTEVFSELSVGGKKKVLDFMRSLKEQSSEVAISMIDPKKKRRLIRETQPTKMVLNAIGKKIEQRLEELKMSIPELTRRSGVSRQTLYNCIYSQARPLSDTIQNIGTVLEKPINWFLEADGPEGWYNLNEEERNKVRDFIQTFNREQERKRKRRKISKGWISRNTNRSWRYAYYVTDEKGYHRIQLSLRTKIKSEALERVKLIRQRLDMGMDPVHLGRRDVFFI